jgi:O-antigen/teichoic acid export membrane protein
VLIATGAALTFVFGDWGFDSEVAWAVAAALVVLPLAAVQAVARLPLLLERRRSAYVSVGLVQAGVGMAVAVAVVVAGVGPAGYFLGLAVGAGCALAATLATTGLLTGRPSFDRARAVALLRYGIPLVPATVMGWVVFAVDRSLIVAFRDVGEAGYYGLASRVTAPLLLAVSAFGVAWAPLIMSQARARQPELRARALTAVLSGTGAVFLVLVLFAEPLVRLFGGAEYAPAARAVPGLALGWLGWAAASVLLTEFAVTKRTPAIAAISGLAATANVLLNVILIPPFGFTGAAWATAASFWLLALAAWIWERRLTSTPYRWIRLAAIAAVLCSIAPAAALADTAAGIVAKAVLAIAGGAALAYVAVGDRAKHPLEHAGDS